MQVTRITTAESLERLAPAWNHLSGGIPFRTWQWLFNWWKHYSEGRSLYTLVVHDASGVLVGAAPWFIERRGNDGRVVQFLGSGHVCSEYLTILSTPENAHDVTTAIAAWLVTAVQENPQAADAWDLLDFEGVTAGDENMAILVDALHKAGCTFKRRPGMDCWRMPLPTSWEAFSSGLRNSQSRQVRRVQKRLYDTGRGVVRTVREASELESALQTFVDLHQLRWSNLGEPGCFASREFHGFIHDCAVDLLAAGMLNLSWLEIDGKPAAVEFLLSTPATLYVYQGGMDPATRKHAPGHALMSSVFRDAIAAGCQHADFLRGDEPYKAAWGACPFAAERIRIAPSRWRPQLRNQAWFAGQVMKSWVKQGFSLAGVH